MSSSLGLSQIQCNFLSWRQWDLKWEESGQRLPALPLFPRWEMEAPESLLSLPLLPLRKVTQGSISEHLQTPHKLKHIKQACCRKPVFSKLNIFWHLFSSIDMVANNETRVGTQKPWMVESPGYWSLNMYKCVCCPDTVFPTSDKRITDFK